MLKKLSKTLFFVLLLSGFCATAFAQIVSIPDADFKYILVNGPCVDTDGDTLADAPVDTNGDGEIQVTEALAVRSLKVDSLSINSLQGIESFSNLESLNCSYNQLTNLDLQNVASLIILNCAGNQLTGLNVQNLANLFWLKCTENQLTSLNLQGLVSLDELNCNFNQLTSLNVLGLSSLNRLDCSNNNITSLTVQGMTSLYYLICNENRLVSLNVQGAINLTELRCSTNLLTSLTVQNLTNLWQFRCDNNRLTNLNVQGTSSLTQLFCDSNQLTSLNLQGQINLSEFLCGFNQLTSLNLQGLVSLQQFWCEYNQLTSLNLQSLVVLNELRCGYNPISCLPFLPNTLTLLDAANTNIACLPNIPAGITTTLPLCTSHNSNGCLFGGLIYGKVYQDMNINCVVDPSDIAQKNILVQARNTATQAVFTTNTDVQGHYELGLPVPATYEVTTIFQNNYWLACPPQTITLAQNLDQIVQDMLIRPVVACADMEIGHQIQNIARPCSTAVYKVSYFNSGTIASNGAFAQITLPTELTLQYLSRPYTTLGNNAFEIQLPPLAALESDTLTFRAFVGCGTQLGQVLCTDVEILPRSFCNATPAGWDGSDIAITGRCIGQDSVRFIIANIGNGGMGTSRNFGVVEDNVMIRAQVFQLAAGASDSITVASDPHKIYRMIADEAPNNPSGNTQETFLIWGCNGNTGVHWGFVNQFGLNNGSTNPHLLCTPIRSSFDPNELSAVAEGTEAAHFILQNTDLTYTIRFQNTGNDTAFTVRLVNQLPAELEEATLRMGTASHPFTWHLAANGALEFLFTHILLPDSTTNEPNSHGFVTYNIKTKPNLAAATTINNQAAIYFDVNAPVMTNVYTHTIATQLRDLFLTTTYNQPSKPILLRIFPNPTATNLTVQVEDVEKWYEVKILNILGQMVATQIIKSKNSVLNTENLPSGTYYIHISNEKSQTIAKFVKL